uniref:Leucine-rich repeat-containing protein 49-like n=1 Tax=Scleropages formosus TaxID=113540 RepID=A0A8C9SRW8_SCLFO
MQCLYLPAGSSKSTFKNDNVFLLQNRTHYPDQLQYMMLSRLFPSQNCKFVYESSGEKVRQLNLQFNLITQIQNLSHLQRLVFLDMSHNRISDMSGISSLCCLQVLLLGKNRIKKISGLENVTRLDILDLHGNQISQIENLSHLSGLCILNLAGNSISRVDNLQGMNSLTELNLCQNCISSVTEVDQLPCLQRLFLSCNSISSFDQLSCLGKSFSLLELTLDGNPVARDACYKHTVLRCMLRLGQLDTKRVTEEERRLAYALARKGEEKKESHKQALQKVMYTETGSGNAQNLCLSNNHLAEVDGGTLLLFGPGALEVLERGWSTLTPLAVTTISFRYIHFNIIVPTFPSIRVKFPNLTHLIFFETDISRLPQLSALAQVSSLNQLTIHPEGNPVVGMVLWRPYLVYRLHHLNLQKVNDLEVTMDEVVSAKRIFGCLGLVAAKETPNCCLLRLLEGPR